VTYVTVLHENGCSRKPLDSSVKKKIDPIRATFQRRAQIKLCPCFIHLYSDFHTIRDGRVHKYLLSNCETLENRRRNNLGA